MNNQLRALAEIHKMRNPSDERSIDELEAHYRNLQQSSPFARAVQQIVRADEMDEMIRYAQDLAETWAHLGTSEMIEQVEAHLESCYSDADDDTIAAVLKRTVLGPGSRHQKRKGLCG